MLSCPIVSDVCSHVARKIHTQFTLSARLGGKVSNLELYLTWKYSFLEKSNNAKLFSTTGLFLSANLWSELRDQISKTIVMVGLCESELTAGGIHWFWFNSADCKNNNKIDKIELIIDIQAKQINEYLFVLPMPGISEFVDCPFCNFLYFHGIWQFLDRWHF